MTQPVQEPSQARTVAGLEFRTRQLFRRPSPIGDPVDVHKHISTGTSADSTNVKASPGNVHGWFLSNINASTRYVKLYNKATAPTVGSDTPKMTIAIPGGASANVDFTNGIAFSLGIGFGITTAVADNSSAAVAANDVVVNLLYL